MPLSHCRTTMWGESLWHSCKVLLPTEGGISLTMLQRSSLIHTGSACTVRLMRIFQKCDFCETPDLWICAKWRAALSRPQESPSCNLHLHTSGDVCVRLCQRCLYHCHESSGAAGLQRCGCGERHSH